MALLGVRAWTLAGFAALSLAALSRSALAADTVVQIPVGGIIDGRTVTTWTDGALVTWSPGQGVDGDGNGDGYVTTAAEAELVKAGKTVGGQAGKALPDDGLFPMDARHPAIQLHFSNAADKASPQTHQLYIAKGAQTMNLPVPAATYSKLFLILTASEGAAALTIKLNYAGGAQPVEQKLMLPDYGIGGAKPNDPVFFNLIDGMRKWTSTNQEGDGPSHTITGIELAPSATDKLTSVDITKTNGSHVVFWGATGIATSPVDVGAGGAGGGGAAGAGTGGAGAGSGGLANGGTAGATAIAGAATGGVAGSVTAAGASTGGNAAAGSSPVTSAGSGGSGNTAAPAATAHDDGGCSYSPSPVQRTALALLAGVVIGLGLRRRRAAPL
jgi:hypothetical protein